MTFTTLTYCLFLWIVFALHWSIASRRWQNAVLVVASYFFYGWWDYRFCGLMLISSLLDYGVGLALGTSERPAVRRALLVFACVVQLGVLGVFKYFNFFAENLHALLLQIGWETDPIVLRILLPVGISFYTFQTLSYSFDVYRRHMEPTWRLLDYMTYVAFFPQLVAGPIERATHLLPQFYQARSFDRVAAVDGCRQMLWGVFKKLAVADNLSRVVEPYYSQAGSSSGVQLIVATICFAFQIYCDFSAYSDIAIGSGKLFGISLMRNFAYPYFSQDLVEFWRRWHISLSTWFRDYVYIPLGGSRVAVPRQAWNVLITFVLSGLWHGASWNFVIWGALNGLGMLPVMFLSRREILRATDVPGGSGVLPSVGFLIRALTTFLWICIAWVFFRAADLPTAMMILRKMAAEGMVISQWRATMAGANLLAMLLIGVLLVVEWARRSQPHPLVFTRAPRWVRWTCYMLLLWGTMYLTPRSTSAFIYFQF
jgi:alginate O-acetyltransferase complex protein AlgI